MKQKIKDYTNKDCCLNCDGFCWWDGDYCCIKQMKIHQYGYGNENGGYTAYPFMNEDIDNTMQTCETCEDYSYVHHEIYPDSKNLYKKEYRKFKKWDNLCKQLEAHVSDPSGVYKQLVKIGIVRFY